MSKINILQVKRGDIFVWQNTECKAVGPVAKSRAIGSYAIRVKFYNDYPFTVLTDGMEEVELIEKFGDSLG